MESCMKKIIKQIEELHKEYEEEFFNSQIQKDQLQTIIEVDRILEILNIGDMDEKTKENKEFLFWSGDKLINAEAKLSRYSEMIGDWITFHESRSDFAWLWRKGKMAEDWQPMKTELKNNLDKVTNPEVENKLIEKYLGEQFYSMFHRRRTDYLIRKIEAIDRMLRTIAHRLKELSRQEYLKQDNN